MTGKQDDGPIMGESDSDTAFQAALRTQLSELNRRSHVYSQRLWQIPLLYVTASAVVLRISEDQGASSSAQPLLLIGILGVVLTVHAGAMAHGIKRAVCGIRKVEGDLHLDETVEWLPLPYILPLLGLIAGVTVWMVVLWWLAWS